MKVLFVARHHTYFRNFESVLRELAERGHAVHAVAERDEAFGGRQLMEELAARYPTITYGDAPSRTPDDDWGWVASWLRLGLDYLRYQHPLFDDAPKLRERASDRTPSVFVALSRIPLLGRWSRGLQSALLRRLERALPEDPDIRTYLEHARPDLLLITPLIDLGSSQVDYLRVARAMGIPSALCVWSWDHLSSKALIRETPDRVFVWNETQKREAIELHRVPESRLVVTGAQCFDQWFDRQPSRDRSTFCQDVGLPEDRPIVLYTCSALFGGSPSEAAFVIDWIRRLRKSGEPHLSSAAILVRPHPSRLSEWEPIDLDGLGPVALWGSNPVNARARDDYYDSLHHAAAVVGLNTSAFIEAAIAGRQVLTVLLPEFHDNQMGTLHFRYLRVVGGGLLTVAESFDEHFRQLESALVAPSDGAARFVEAFVRPLGLATRATTVFADAVDAMRGLVPQAARVDRWMPLWRRAAASLGRAHRQGRYERWLLSAREYASVLELRTVVSGKQARQLALERERAESRARRESERLAREELKRQAVLAAQLERERLEREHQRVVEERVARRQAEEAARLKLVEEEREAKLRRVAERDVRRQRHADEKRAAKRRLQRGRLFRERVQAAWRRLTRVTAR